MTGQDEAAWAQALVSGAAIVISSLIAVFVPWNERRIVRQREERARLDVHCSVSESGGLKLLIGYLPEFHHQALSATVQLVEPKDACVYKGEPDGVEDGRIVGRIGSLANNLRYNGTPLIKYNSIEQPDLYQGFMFIEYPDERKGPVKAKVKISLLTHGNRLIAEYALDLTPDNVDFWPNGAPIAVLDYRRKF